MADINFSSKALIEKGSGGTPTDQKIGKFIMGTVVVGIVLTILYYLLPVLVPIFNNIQTISSAIAKSMIWATIAFIIFVIVKKQTRNLDHLADALSRAAFKKIIEFDPFVIQYKQIAQAEEDVEKMMKEKGVVDGKYTELNTKIKNYTVKFNTYRAGYAELQEKIKNPGLSKDEQDAINLAMQDAIMEQAAAKKYIDSITPICNDMKYLSEFISDGYKVLKIRIKAAKNNLNVSKDIFESAKAGGRSIERMKRAMVGDIKLNNEAEIAQMEVMKDIALTVGQMKVSMEIIGSVTREANLEEGSKLAYAKEQLQQLNLTEGQALPINTATANFNNIPTLKVQQPFKLGGDSDF